MPSAGGVRAGWISYRFLWKVFAQAPVPPVDMHKETLCNGKLPDSLDQALIILLLKPGKEANLCSSYRPISLLNTDYKILAKIIANRLSPLVPDLIAMDQTGFVTKLLMIIFEDFTIFFMFKKK